MAEHGTLPPYVWPYDTSVHPPLYHALASLVFRIFAPRFGSPAALLAIRLLTGLCAPGIVYLAYRSARNFTSRSGALLAATFVLLVPMRASLSGGITNENLAALGAAGAFAVLLGGVRGRAGFTPRRLVLLMLWTVVGVGSKLTCLGLLPAAAIALIDAGRRRRRHSCSGRALLQRGTHHRRPLAPDRVGRRRQTASAGRREAQPRERGPWCCGAQRPLRERRVCMRGKVTDGFCASKHHSIS